MRQPERGSQLLIRLIAWLALRLGRPLARLLLYPICGYFVLFGGEARRASREYLTRLFGRPARNREVFAHYHSFASVVLDRVYFLTNRLDLFQITKSGADLLDTLRRDDRGVLLLGAHLGSFEALRAEGIARMHLPLKVLMYDRNAEKVNAVFDALNPAFRDTVIPIGSATTLLKAKEVIDCGHLLGVLGDRTTDGERAVTCRFLGREAKFPAGPLLLAGLLKVPVVMAFGLYRGGARYDLHFELLTECVDLSGPNRLDAVQRLNQAYADRLEHYCREAPYNWFNFYDFWSARG
jgi:predicted LPLAT superfamily acyltransferase